MTDPHDNLDPVRLASSSDDALLKNLLRAGEREVASAEQMALLAAKLGPIVGGADGAGGAGGAGAGAAAVVKASAGLTATTKLLGAIGIGITVAASGAFLTSRSSEAPQPIASTSSTESAPTPAVPFNAPPPTAATIVTEVAPAIASAASPARAATTASARTNPPPTASAPPEVNVLQRAQDALGANPSEALSLCDDLARRLPNGLLAQEREVIAIDALTRLGRIADARERAGRFRLANPSSSHLGRVEVLVGKGF